MPSSVMLRRVALLRTDVSQKCTASIIRVTRIGELGTLVVFIRSVRRLLVLLTLFRNIPQDGIVHSCRRENLKPYIRYQCSPGDCCLHLKLRSNVNRRFNLFQLRSSCLWLVFVPTLAASLVEWSEFLATDIEVPGSIPGATSGSETEFTESREDK
jgi:hypothetical protein